MVLFELPGAVQGMHQYRAHKRRRKARLQLPVHTGAMEGDEGEAQPAGEGDGPQGEELPADGAYRPEELLPFAMGELGAVEAQAALGLFADSIGWAQRAGWSPEAATGSRP